MTIEGDKCDYFPIFKSGLIRVYYVGSFGQEINLYRAYSGESCILTTSCLIAKNNFPAISIVEENSKILLVPENKLKEYNATLSENIVIITS